MAASSSLTPGAVRLIVAITLLSVGHHVDHLLRDVTGWPVGDAFNPALVVLASLFVALAAHCVHELRLAQRRRSGRDGPPTPLVRTG